MDEEPLDRSQRTRREILRDLLVFQVKLWLEGMKDLVLVPLSLGAALIDVLFRGKGRGGALYGVMSLGDRFEDWVNLYGALDREPPVGRTKRAPDPPFSKTGPSQVEMEVPDSVSDASSSASHRQRNG